MASIVIRNIEDALKESLRVRAAKNGRSMEEEARMILRAACSESSSHENIADLAQALFSDRGIDLDPHPPVPARPAPNFNE